MTGAMVAAPTLDELIVSNPNVMSGRRVFRGTRVPVEVVFENLADGMSLEEILDDYATLDRADVVRVIELTSDALARPRAACRYRRRSLPQRMEGFGQR